MVDTLPLVFNQDFVNDNGDTFRLTKFNYFISNIVITKNDNSTFAEPNSYHLVKHASPASNVITLANVPTGSYKGLSFVIGVDSTMNASGVKKGDLDPVVSSDMYWDWNSGFIAVKVEGTSPQSGSGTKSITFHIGGYGGVNKAQRPVSLSFGAVTADVSTAVTPLVHLSVDVLEFFKTPNTVKFATDYFQMATGSGAKKYADNYANMIEFEHVHN